MTQALPVLFNSLEALDAEKHKDFKFTPMDNFAHTKELHAVQTVLGEIPSLTNTYPIAFAPMDDGEVSLVAVLGLAEGKNAYLDDDNKWMAEYVPAYIQRYPFIAVLVEGDKDKQKVLCVDEKAPHFVSSKGEPMFGAKGEPSEVVTKSLKMVEEFDFSEAQTREFCEEVASSNILEDWQENSEYGSISFKRINVNALESLPEKKITDWHKKGYITIILNIVQSQRSWREIEARLTAVENGKKDDAKTNKK